MSDNADLATLLTSLQQGDHARALEQLFAEVNAQAVQKASRSNLATRKAAWAKAVRSYDVEKLTELQTTMQNYVDHIARIDTLEPRELTEVETSQLMAEHSNYKEIAEFLESRKDTIKKLVFAHLDETVGPNQNGAVPVPEMGMKFTREGCGIGTPTIDADKLKGLLGDDWSEVVDVIDVPEQYIPAYHEEILSEDKLLELAARRPEVFEHLRESLIPGKQKTARFQARPLAEEE
jgi:hypothetical protein